MSRPKVLSRFLQYTKVNTTSDPLASPLKLPTTDGQRVLAEQIAAELKMMDIPTHYENGILYAKIPGCEGVPTVGFAPHLDTAPDYTADTTAEVVNYVEGDLVLKNDVAIPRNQLVGYEGQDIVVTQGDSLLGGDDKAAIAAVVTAIEEILDSDEKHGPVHIAFLPDEEIGLLGAKSVDKTHFSPDFGYCLDCCEVGEYVTKTWSAATAKITIKGTPAHPMTAKGNLVNPITIFTSKIVSKIPPEELPENTEGEEGFLWVKDLTGTGLGVEAVVIMRYFDPEKMQERKSWLTQVVEDINAEQPLAGGRASITISDTYSDPSQLIEKHPHVTELMLSAMRALNITPRPKAMRGGYDGCALAAHGIPTANFFTGAHNFHSNTEFLPVPSLIAAKDMVKHIILSTPTIQL